MAPRTIGRDYDLRGERLEPLAQVVRVVGPVGQQALRQRDVVEQDLGDTVVGDVAWSRDEGNRLALSVGQSVDLAGPSATLQAERLRRVPLLTQPLSGGP